MAHTITVASAKLRITYKSLFWGSSRTGPFSGSVWDRHLHTSVSNLLRRYDWIPWGTQGSNTPFAKDVSFSGHSVCFQEGSFWGTYTKHVYKDKLCSPCRTNTRLVSTALVSTATTSTGAAGAYVCIAGQDIARSGSLLWIGLTKRLDLGAEGWSRAATVALEEDDWLER